MPDQNVASLYNSLLYSQLSSQYKYAKQESVNLMMQDRNLLMRWQHQYTEQGIKYERQLQSYWRISIVYNLYFTLKQIPFV